MLARASSTPSAPATRRRRARSISVDFLDVPPEQPLPRLRQHRRAPRRHGRLRRRQLLPGRTGHPRADGRLPAEGQARRRPRAAAGDRHGLRSTCPPGAFAADWIEELASLGVTGGCGSGNYCPDAPVTRAQMAVFLLKTLQRLGVRAARRDRDLRRRAGRAPSPPTGSRTSTREASPAAAARARCSTVPDNPNTRGQMAVFLTKTFRSAVARSPPCGLIVGT